VVIFPQGTRAGPGEPRVIQPGVAALAGAMGVPVIPVATNSGDHWGRNAFTKRPGVIEIVIGAPLPADLSRGALVSALEDAWTRLEAKIHNPVDKTVGEPVSIFASRSKDFL
jgi:1-acyl-sn-glycerol-3-phosphate acyltransferase